MSILLQSILEYAADPKQKCFYLKRVYICFMLYEKKL